NEPRYHPGSKTKTPANCGTPASQQNYRVIRKSGDAVCIWLPEGGNGECTWVIAPSAQIVATGTAPKNFWPEGTGMSDKGAGEKEVVYGKRAPGRWCSMKIPELGSCLLISKRSSLQSAGLTLSAGASSLRRT